MDEDSVWPSARYQTIHESSIADVELMRENPITFRAEIVPGDQDRGAYFIFLASAYKAQPSISPSDHLTDSILLKVQKAVLFQKHFLRQRALLP